MIEQFSFTMLLTILIIALDSRIGLDALWAQSQSTSTATALGQLAVVEGEVRLRSEGSSENCHVSVGSRFKRGDLLEVAASARAVVVCADLTKHELKAGVHGLPCKPPSTGARVLFLDGAWIKINDPRGKSSASNIPIIISPRKTKLLNPRPILRWAPIAGRTKYIINVRGWNLDWSENVGPKTEIPYPQDEDKQLTPGVIYKLTIKAGNHSSDDEGVSNLFFTLLTPREAQVIHDQRQKIISLGLPELTTQLMVAQLYAESELNSEAIEQLCSLPVKVMESAVLQLLGDIYFNCGLTLMAEEQYLLALEVADKKQDLFNKAQAQSSLGQLYEMLGNRGKAITYWQQAKELYRRLADKEMIEKVEDALRRLSPR
jgi:hypothetical protein